MPRANEPVEQIGGQYWSIREEAVNGARCNSSSTRFEHTIQFAMCRGKAQYQNIQ